MIGERNLYRTKVSSSIPEQEGQERKAFAYKEDKLDKLASRFYYHAHLCRLRYDDCLVELSREFDLTSHTLVRKIQQRSAFLDRLTAAKTTALQLKKRYPYFDWSRKPYVIQDGPQRRRQR